MYNSNIYLTLKYIQCLQYLQSHIFMFKNNNIYTNFCILIRDIEGRR